MKIQDKSQIKKTKQAAYIYNIYMQVCSSHI